MIESSYQVTKQHTLTFRRLTLTRSVKYFIKKKKGLIISLKILDTYFFFNRIKIIILLVKAYRSKAQRRLPHLK